MLRFLLAAILGGVIYQGWLMASWMGLKLHDDTIGAFPEPAAVTSSLVEADLASGVYSYPWPASDEDIANRESEFYKQHTAGPTYTIYYHREGSEPMPPSMMVKALVMNVASAGLIACLLSCTSGCCRSYFGRVGFVLGMGIFATLVSHGAYWNWMKFPDHYTLIMATDVIVGWTLAGLLIAALVRPKAEPVAE